MSRIVRYTYNANSVPVDPDENSTIYTNPITYQAGYYKAKAWEDGDSSVVVSSSFERVPEDYIHYYPLTNDFNDHKGSNNLSVGSGFVTNDVYGAFFNASNDRLDVGIAINTPNISVSLWYKTGSSVVDIGALLYETGGSSGILLYINNRYFGYRSTDDVFYSTFIQANSNSTYNIIITKTGTVVSMYINGTKVINDSINGSDNSIYPLKYIGNTPSSLYCATGYYKDIKIYNRILTQQEITDLYNLG